MPSSEQTGPAAPDLDAREYFTKHSATLETEIELLDKSDETVQAVHRTGKRAAKHSLTISADLEQTVEESCGEKNGPVLGYSQQEIRKAPGIRQAIGKVGSSILSP